MEGRAGISPVAKALYRSLLRLAIRYDKNPIAKGLLHRNDPKTHGNASSLYYSIILNQIFGKKKFFLPDDQNVSFRSIVRKEYLFPNNDFPVETRLDAAFTCLRKFSNIMDSYRKLIRSPLADLESEISKFESENKNLIHEATGKEEVEEKESKSEEETKDIDELRPINKILKSLCPVGTNELVKGTLLLTHPGLVNSLERSVVLLLEHEEAGSYGIVINKPGVMLLEEGIKGLPDEFYELFDDKVIHSGGPIKRFQTIHNLPECGGKLLYGDETQRTRATELDGFLNPPFFYSMDLAKAIPYLKEHSDDANNVHFFAGCLIWDAHQLQKQVDEGYWITAKADIPSLLNLLHFQTVDVISTVLGRLFTPAARNNVIKRGKSQAINPRDVNPYHLILEALSEEHALLAKLPPVHINDLETCD